MSKVCAFLSCLFPDAPTIIKLIRLFEKIKKKMEILKFIFVKKMNAALRNKANIKNLQ